MTNGEFESLISQAPELVTYMERAAKLKTRIEPVQEDCVQDAMIRVSQAPAGMGLEYYQAVVKTAVDTSYRREWRYWQKKKRLHSMANSLYQEMLH